MKLTKPYFYDKFLCIADRCTDNCCIGWEIDIDDSAMARFNAAGGEFGERLRCAIHKCGDTHTFAFGEGERCALLREDGLCELILNMGEDSLCDICALHPRFFGWYNGLKEAGLGLCCEEVCRLLFSDSEPLSFVTEETDEDWEETCSDELLDILLSARSQIFNALQQRTLPLCDRMYSAAEYTRKLQQVLDNGGELSALKMTGTAPQCDIKPTVEALFKLLGSMESISAEWDDTLARLTARQDELCEALPRFLALHSDSLWRYEHIAVYFCYRYFLDGVFLGEVVSRLGMMCASVLSVALIDCLTWLEKGTLSEWDRVLDLKLYSKQVEYSADNVELLYDAVWDVPQLAPERLSAVFGA